VPLLLAVPLLGRRLILDIDSAISKVEDLFDKTIECLQAVKKQVVQAARQIDDLEEENQELREALGDVEVTPLQEVHPDDVGMPKKGR